MNLYDIMNPCDDLTMYAPSIEVAGAALGILGQGRLGARDVKTDERTPLLIGWEPWFKERQMDPLGPWIIAHGAEIVAALRTIMLSTPENRAEIDAMLAQQEDPQARDAWILSRNEKIRSSMNDIEGNAHRMAGHLENRLRETAEVKP